MTSAPSYWNKRVRRRSVLVGGGAAAFMAACGGSNNGGNNSASKPSASAPASAATSAASAASPAVRSASGVATAAAATTQGQPKPGGTLRYHLQKEAGNLDPHLATDSSTTAIANLVYNSMLRFTTGPTVDTSSTVLEGELAEKWETPDSQTVTLHIRQGVKWHNKAPLNGRAFTAEDAKDGILRIGTNKPEFQRATFFKGIDHIDVPDANTIVIKQKEPNVPFVTYLAVPYHKILPRELTDKDLAKTQAIGTGPFTVDTYTLNNTNTFKKSPDYFKKGLPYLDAVELTGVIEPATRLDAFRAGKTDILIFSKAADADDVKKQVSAVQTENFTPFTYYNCYGFDVTNPKLADERVREAIALIIDHAGVRKAVFQDQAVRSTPIPVGMKDWTADPKELEFYVDKPDLQKAKQLLDAAGVTTGFKVTMDTNASYADEIEIMPLLQQNLTALGIDVTDLKKIEPAAFLGPTNMPGGFEMRLWHHSAFSEPDEFLSNFYQRGASRNYGGWGTEAMDAQIKQQRNLSDKVERKKVLVQIQKDLAHTNWRIGTELQYEFVGWYKKVMGWWALAADPGYYSLPFENTWLSG